MYDPAVLNSSFGSSPCGEEVAEVQNVTSLLGIALHEENEMRNEIGRNTMCTVIKTICKPINLAQYIRAVNVGSGTLGPHSLKFMVGAGRSHKNPDVTVTRCGIIDKVLLLQVEIKIGSKFIEDDRTQLRHQMIGSLLGQRQIAGLLICAAKAELFFAHRSRQDSKLRLFLMKSFNLYDKGSMADFLDKLRKVLLFQACSFLIDPFHNV